MAAIDKIYAKSFYEYDKILKWVLIYYPKMLVNFYDIHRTAENWQSSEDYYVEHQKMIFEEAMKKLGNFETNEEAIQNLIKHYADVGYECPYEQAKSEVEYILENAEYTDVEIAMMHTVPIACPTFKQDKILKWRCPIPFVREYLESHCGYKTKWYHKLFFKGKKSFS